MYFFDTIPPKQFTLLATFLGVLLLFELDVDEQNSMGNFLIQIGQTVVTAAAQSTNIEAKSTKSAMSERIDQMCAELEKMKKQLKC